MYIHLRKFEVDSATSLEDMRDMMFVSVTGSQNFKLIFHKTLFSES